MRVDQTFKYFEFLVIKSIVDINLVEALIGCWHYSLTIVCLNLLLTKLIFQVQSRY